MSIETMKKKLEKGCRAAFYLGVFSLSIFGGAKNLNGAQLNIDGDPTKLGKQLETQFWNAVKKQNVNRFSDKLAHIFQGLNLEGVYTREEQIDGLTGAVIVSFEINNGVGHRRGKDLVFSYDLMTVSDDVVSGPNLSIWRFYPLKGNERLEDHSSCSESSSGNNNHKGVWKMISHSYVPLLG